jgi:hypothetical protein
VLLVADQWFSPKVPVFSNNTKWPPQNNSNIDKIGIKHK